MNRFENGPGNANATSRAPIDRAARKPIQAKPSLKSRVKPRRGGAPESRKITAPHCVYRLTRGHTEPRFDARHSATGQVTRRPQSCKPNDLSPFGRPLQLTSPNDLPPVSSTSVANTSMVLAARESPSVAVRAGDRHHHPAIRAARVAISARPIPF